MSENCGNCRFYRRLQFSGVCRRYPPVKSATLGMPGYAYHQPELSDKTYCGEWSAKTEESKPLPEQAADLTPDRMRQLYPHVREEPVKAPAYDPMRGGRGVTGVEQMILDRASKVLGSAWPKSIDGQQARAFHQAILEIQRLENVMAAMQYAVETWPRPFEFTAEDWDVQRKMMVTRMRAIGETKT